jgi:hypothetical protein
MLVTLTPAGGIAIDVPEFKSFIMNSLGFWRVAPSGKMFQDGMVFREKPLSHG